MTLQPCPWVSPDKNTGGGCHFLLQGIFLTQGLSRATVSPDCRQILDLLSHWGSPKWGIAGGVKRKKLWNEMPLRKFLKLTYSWERKRS